jgi:hypothetical protein
MSIYYGISGLVGGLLPIFAGRLIDLFKGMEGKFLWFPVTHYTIPFMISILFLLVSQILLYRLYAGEEMSFRQFLRLFVSGNPIKAIIALTCYYMVNREQERITQIQRLGESRSPFVSKELIKALSDPSSRIRSEAILAISKLPKTDEIITVLLNILNGSDTELYLNTIRGLACVREPRVVQLFRDMAFTDNHYDAGVKSAVIRSLGETRNPQNERDFINRFRMVKDPSLKLSYAIALLRMDSKPISNEILKYCDTLDNPMDRQELCMGFAQMIGMEKQFLKCWRQMQSQPGTTVAMNLMIIARKLMKKQFISNEEFNHWSDCANGFAANDFDHGIRSFEKIIQPLIAQNNHMPAHPLLHDCYSRIMQYKNDRQEYIILLICLLNQITMGENRTLSVH